MRAVLTGRPYPRSLLANVLMRMRSDGHLSGLRVGICKAFWRVSAASESTVTRRRSP